jgi:hypothetical protein
LRFNLEGWPRGRAAPANLEPHPQVRVWGVLYAITRRDLVRLDASEGIPWWRYRQLWLEVEDAEGHTLRAVTYIAQGDEIYRRPSLRYITLLREGARAHGLPIATCAFWRGLNTRDSPAALMPATARGLWVHRPSQAGHRAWARTRWLICWAGPRMGQAASLGGSQKHHTFWSDNLIPNWSAVSAHMHLIERGCSP